MSSKTFIAPAMIDPDQLKGCANFFAAHLISGLPDKPRNWQPTVNDIHDRLDVICKYVHHAPQKHSIAMIIHPHDYFIRDWRAYPLLPQIYTRFMQYTGSHYLTTIFMHNSVRKVKCRSLTDGFLRPFFPLRCTMCATFFLINRDIDATYKNWHDTTDAIGSTFITSSWRSSRAHGSYTLMPLEYRRLLELFCHPDAVILDILPHHGGVATAAAMIDRTYIGMYTDAKVRDSVIRRIHYVEEAKLDEIVDQFVPAATRIHKVKKAYRLYGRWSGVR